MRRLIDRTLTPAAIPAVLLAMLAADATPAVAADEPAFTRTAGSPELDWGPCPAFMPEGCRLSILHGDPAQPGVDVFFKLPAGTRAPSHWHTSAERMVLVSGRMAVTYAGQEPVTLTAGTYAYGPARRDHRAECVSEEDCVLFIAFEQPLDAVPADAR